MTEDLNIVLFEYCPVLAIWCSNSIQTVSRRKNIQNYNIAFTINSNSLQFLF